VEQLSALLRLCQHARGDSGQARRVADFLLAWYNAEENGCWDPADLWSVDAAIAEDMLTVLTLIRQHPGKYPEDFGCQEEIESIWKAWRGRGEP
jgi:predicted metal-dependent phosphoesterase TrpH